MTDPRYKVIKNLTDVVPEWAQGCDQCKCGLVAAPDLTHACELHLERLVQAIDGSLQFCTCRAGVRYQVYLRNRFLFLKDEAKRSNFTDKAAHPDIEIARQRIARSYEMAGTVPTVHYEPEREAA